MVTMKQLMSNNMLTVSEEIKDSNKKAMHTGDAFLLQHGKS